MTHLCIDFGTSSTVAVLAGPQGVRPVLFDGAPSLPSGVCADPNGRLLTGADAEHAAQTSPERYEPNPKQRIDEQSVLLGGVEFAVADLIAAVLRRVVAQLPAPPQRVTLTHPAAWGSQRREVLWEAAARAGLGSVRLVSEPVAAAAHFATHAKANVSIPSGGSVLVCDVGAGTVDVSVVRRTPTGFEVLASTGLTDGGGLDLDAAIVAYLGTVFSPRNGAAWQRLVAPATPADRQATRALWTAVRTGKEALTRAPSTHIHLPILQAETPLGREQFESLARPVVERTTATAQAVLREARVEPAALSGVFLVGGGTRVPLIASMLHRVLGVVPQPAEKRELAVARGAVTAEDVSGPDMELTVKSQKPLDRTKVYAAAAIPVRKPPKDVKRKKRTGRRRVLFVALVLIASAGIAGGVTYLAADRGGTSTPGGAQNSWNGDFVMQINAATQDRANGTLLISVREAELEDGEGGATIDGTDPWVTVTVDESAEVYRADRSPSSVEELLRDLNARDPEARGQALELTFSPDNKVTKVEWLYPPAE
ncbi:Hsp70 family protein [Catenuloplanes japonicus]|uniref:Hsp70 family protein n=1 Tax=Catenuloplanes japonicus TaxID=33876 RepID=UPI0006899E5B|nr:Hsp70 family protein [Catenuloplanes japonicus]